MMKDCDHKYMGGGPAYMDVVDFVRDEAIWLKAYAKAWHVATENGRQDLTFLNSNFGPKRETPSTEEAYDCASISLDECWSHWQCMVSAKELKVNTLVQTNVTENGQLYPGCQNRAQTHS